MKKPNKSWGNQEKLPIDLALKQAAKSVMTYRVGAVLFKDRKVLGLGYGFHPAYSVDNKRVSIHAEASTMVGLRHDAIRGADMLIIRINPKGEMMPIRPCKRCKNLMTRKGIRKVYYWSSEMDLTTLAL